MKSGKLVCVLLSLMVCGAQLISCGGGGGGGFFYNAGLQAPSADLTGTWAVQETISGNCQGKTYPENDSYTATITQSGNSITYYDPTENYSYQGTISGNAVSWNVSRPNDSGGTTAINFSGTVSSDGNALTGSAAWTWTNSGGTNTCNGTTGVTATRIVFVFDSDRIHVERTADGKLVVRFTDAIGQSAEVQGTPNGAEQMLYDQDGTQVALTAEGNAQLVTPYTNAVGSVGASTLTVYSDYTAIEVLDADGIYDYRFYFADSGTGNLAYEAKLADDVGQLKAIFNYPNGGSELGRQNATMTYNADSSRALSFSNPYGSGRSAIDYTTPVRYANVAGIAFYNTRLHVYLKTDGNYIVDYYGTDGKRKYTAEVVLNGSAQSLYNDSEATLSVLADNTLKMSEPSGLGIHAYALNPFGLAAEHDSSSGENIYAMHFLDAMSGLVEDSGSLKVIAGEWKTEFAALGYLITVDYGSDLEGNITYSTSYNHAQLGEGMFDIGTNSTGIINATNAVITTPHP